MGKNRVIILGIGDWGRKWLDLVHLNPRCEIVGVCGSEAELTRAREAYGFAPSITYTDFRQLVKSVKTDVAINVLPAVLHYEADCLAMESGINIISEKPLATSWEQAKKLLDLKTTHYQKLKFAVSQNYRWRPHNQAIKNAILNDMIGKLEYILLEFRQREYMTDGFRGKLAYPLLEDMSIHHFDLLRFFTGGKCKRVSSQSWRPEWSMYSGKACTNAIIEMDNGVHICYNGSWSSCGKDTSWDGNITITGSKGCLTLAPDNTVRFFKDIIPDGRVVSQDTGTVLQQPDMEFTDMEYMLGDFLNCLETGKAPETTLEDNINSYQMVTACIKSGETGDWVTL